MKLYMKHQGPKPFIFCSNYEPLFNLDLFYCKVKFCNLGVYMGNVTMIDALEFIVSLHLDFG